jgi:hypothetical protein
LAPEIAGAALALSSGVGSVGNFVYNANLQQVINNHQMYWVSSAGTLNNSLYQNALSNFYYGANGQLGGVDVRDTVANLKALSFAGEAGLISFTNTYASGSVQVAIQDTVANTYAALVTANPASFEAQLAADFVGVTKLASHVQINDTVANLEAAYDNGYLAQMVTVANSFFTNANPGASNYGLDVRITDTVANINALIYSGKYAPLNGLVGSYIVTDTAANLVAAFNNGNWSTAIDLANNIVAQDTYANILANQALLFNWSQSNNNGVEATKVIFTDLAGADASHPLIVAPGYSYNGLLPTFDFSSAGFTGAVTVTEIGLSQTAAQTLATQALISNVYAGEMFTLTDTVGKKVVIDVLTSDGNYGTYGNPADPYGTDLFNFVLPSNGNVGNTKINLAADANLLWSSIGPSATNFISILNWGGTDNIQYTGALSVVGFSGVAISGKASIAASGWATFNAADTTLDQQIHAVEAAIHAGGAGAAGHVAYWDNGGNTYALITGDTNTATNTISMHDDLVKLVGVDHTHVQLGAGATAGLLIAH